MQRMRWWILCWLLGFMLGLTCVPGQVPCEEECQINNGTKCANCCLTCLDNIGRNGRFDDVLEAFNRLESVLGDDEMNWIVPFLEPPASTPTPNPEMGLAELLGYPWWSPQVSADGSTGGFTDGSPDGSPQVPADGSIGGFTDGSPQVPADGSTGGFTDGSPHVSADGSPDGSPYVSADGSPDGSPHVSADGSPDGSPQVSADGSTGGFTDGSPDGSLHVSADGSPHVSADGSTGGFADGFANDSADGSLHVSPHVSPNGSPHVSLNGSPHGSPSGSPHGSPGGSPHGSPDSVSSTDEKILTYISLVGCSISLFALVISVLLFITNRKLREDVSMKVHVNLVVALILLNLHFLVGQAVAPGSSTGLCLYMALALHYSLLATFSWMALEGFNLYLLVVKVFDIYVSRYLLKLSVVGWGVPAVIVSVVVIINRGFYGLVFNSNGPAGCYITNKTVKIVTTVGLFSMVFLFNIIVFAVTVKRVFSVGHRNEIDRKRVKQHICRLLGVVALLGITWGLAFFSFGRLTTPGFYVFSILNSLQGFFIFLWFVMSLRKIKNSAPKTKTDTSGTNS